MKIKCLLVFAVMSMSSRAAFDPESGLIQALRWYHRWIRELPSNSKSQDCTVASFSNSSFAYCQPGSLAIDLDSSRT